MDQKTKESGLQRYTGIKKYGKKGFEELQKAGREGANEKEKGAIKDKYLKKKKTNEDLADMAMKAEMDHEVQMARSQLYKTAKYAIKLHEMLKNVSEAEGLDGWVAAKITKASDYIGAVYHHLDYELKFESAVSESIDKNFFHTSVENGKFMKHEKGGLNDPAILYLHDLDNKGSDGESPMLVTFTDQADAEEAQKQYGGKIIRSGMNTFRIIKDSNDLGETISTEYKDTLASMLNNKLNK